MKRIFWLFTPLLVCQLWAAPPPVPSAGIVERELEREYEGQPLQPRKEIPSIQIDIPEERLHMPEGRKVFVREITFRGNSAISTKTLQKWVRPYLDQEMSLRDIYRLCQELEAKYAKKGYFLARVYPPTQTIGAGDLLLSVIEGTLGEITVVGNQHYKESFIRRYFVSQVGKPLNYDDFVKALMLLNENSDLSAGALFEKGKEFGTADLIIRVHDKRPMHLYVNANNYGRNLTTSWRAGPRFDYGNLIVNGDKLSVAGVTGFPFDALYFADVTYTIPVTSKGTFVESAFLFSKFKVEELQPLHLRGSSLIGTLKATQALIRTKHISLNFFSSFDIKQIKNKKEGDTTAYDKIRLLTAGTLFDHFSPSMGRDYLTTRIGVGIPSFLGGMKPVDSECSRAGAGGRFVKFNIDYDHLQLLPKDMYIYFHTSGQWSPYKLPIPEQIYIGGIGTVRGYPLASALGDSGYYANLEFRCPIPFLANEPFFKYKRKWKDIIQLIGFIDHGGVFLQSIENIFEWGTGFGVRVNGPWRLSFSLDCGFPLNHIALTKKGAFVYMKVTGQPF